MTGNNQTPWSWLHNALVPAVLVGTEATWASLCLSAAVNSSRHFSMDLPFAAVAIPAVGATMLCSLTGRLTRRWWSRTVLVAVLVIVGVAATAGAVSQLSLAGSFGAVAYHPWTVVGRIPSDTAALAWFVASVTWARGTWLALQKVSFRHACASVAISTCAFVILFAVLATNPQAALHAATPDAATLFILFFAGAIAVLALVRQRDLESEALQRPTSRPSAVWLTVLAGPMLIVAGFALLVAVIVGPLSPLVGRALERAILAVGAVIGAAGRAIGRILPSAHPVRPDGTRPRSRVKDQPFAIRTTTSHKVGHVPEVIGIIIVVVLVIAILAFVILRGVRWISVRRTPRTAASVHELRESLFSWRHLWEQLRTLLMRLVGRREHSRLQVDNEPTTVDVASGSGVRGEYRRFLREIGRTKVPKNPEETTREFARRLRSLPPAPSAEQAAGVDHLTRLYERVRYGGLADNARDVELAQLLVDQGVGPAMAAEDQSRPAGRQSSEKI
jgi:hypothetical protein